MTQQNTQTNLETVPAPPLPAIEPQEIIELPGIPNMLEYALTHKGVTCMWVERFHNSAQHTFRSVANQAMNEHEMAVKRVNQQELVLTLKNGSKLHFKNMQHPQSMRGYILQWVGINKFVETASTLYTEVIRRSLVREAIAVSAHTPLDMKDAEMLPLAEWMEG